jgi:hypothetical protein
MLRKDTRGNSLEESPWENYFSAEQRDDIFVKHISITFYITCLLVKGIACGKCLPYSLGIIITLYPDSIPRCCVKSFQRSIALTLADSCSALVAFNFFDPLEAQRIDPEETTANSSKSSRQLCGHGMQSQRATYVSLFRWRVGSNFRSMLIASPRDLVRMSVH